MVTVEVIDQLDDPRVADYVGLREPARRSRFEVDGGFFIAEGIAVIQRLLRSDLSTRSLLLSPSRLDRLRPELKAVAAPVYVAERHVMEAIAGFDVHRGALASAQRPLPRSVEDVTEGAWLVAALEGINDHENLGAIFRSAAGLGVDAVLMDPTCADPWYRRSVRVSMGAVLEMPMARAERWPTVLSDLKGFRVVAMSLSDSAFPIDAVRRDTPTVVLLGAEGPGLTKAAIAASDLEVTVPMSARADSLNVGHAAAVAFHHFGSIR